MKLVNRVSRRIRSRDRKRPVNLSFELVEDRVLLATFTVTNNADSGPGSLRQAIIDANATANPTSGADTIDFNIPGPGVQTISPVSPLPSITVPVVINGYTQPGAKPNSLANGDNAVLLIELNGANAPAGTDGLLITAGGSTVEGLVINGFVAVADSTSPSVFGGGDGIELETNGGNTIQGNFIGTDALGTTGLGNQQDGVLISDAPNNTIGGTGAAANTIGHNSVGIVITGSGATGNVVLGNYIGTNASGANLLGTDPGGVWINNASNNTIGGAGNAANTIGFSYVGIDITGSGATGNVVQGNFIGTNANGAKLGNTGHDADGIYINDASNNTIGGANTIGNNGTGIDITGSGATGNVVLGNYIGTNASGDNLGNGDGVVIEAGASNNTIGGTGAGAGNTIAFNTGAAVTVDTGTGNAIRQNSIFANDQGIFLVNGGNADQPAPTLTAADSFPGTTMVEGQLSGFADSTVYTIEFFASAPGDPSTLGQAHVFLGSKKFMTNGSGAATISATLSATVPVGQVITATATSPDNNTSELANGTLTVNPAQPPSNLQLSPSPFSATALAGTVVGTLSATDPNPGDTLTYSLTNNAGGRFVLSGNQVEVSPGATLSPTTYSITAQATDQEGQSVTQTFSLTAVAATTAFSGLTAQDKTVTYGTSTDQLTGTIEAGSQVPTGTVTASVGGVVSQAVPISSTGSFTINLPTGSLAASTTPYPITYNYAGSGNFAAAQDSSTSITVTKAPLTVTASNASRAYGAANPTFADTITGYVDGQNLATSGVTGSPSLTTTANASSLAGTYPITASAGSLSATNYDFTFANGTLTINPSPTVTVVSPFVVTNTNDSGIGSLRFAIQAANADLNHDDTITFQIPTTDPRYHGATRSWTIPVGAGLTIAKPSSEGGQHVVVVDGLSQQSQPGASHTHPVIEITPATGFVGDGLTLNSGGNTVQGLVIDGFQGAGLVLNSGANNNLVVGNFIGTDPTGTMGRGNTHDGISLNDASNNRIIGNVVSGNGINPDAAGINLESNDSNNIIAGNEIGTNAAGDRTLGNSLHGIFIGNGSSNNTIGGPTDNDRNVISGNGQFPVANLTTQGGVGVYIYGANTSGNVVQGNYIGTNASGDNLGNDALTNSVIGVLISQSSGNTVRDNLISGNRFVGLEIAGGTASGNLVQDNKIGTNFDGTRAIPNGQDGITINDAPNNMIGGTAASAGNLISGNGSVGIQLFGPLTQGNVIEGNALGLNSANRLTLLNRKEGIFVNTQPLSNTIGGTAPGQANRGQIPPPYTVSGSQQSNPGSTAQAATAAGRRFGIRGRARRSLRAHSTAHRPMTGGVS